ncbi:uncharacterized protein BP01DRAFT_353705 [Aspergillus saccharolyticus JOP 1030-1]|uniref:Phosphatidylglycerol/phosphatidylinositol transfer protein n=1 Tax=Aspergillus saccharolyticus JOP 1030-1 TaxID=1450539 RepID=A0A318ZLQ6_9EURO|nr:hypothetical protein BP01DRAFT_353705 [Aspergillus saccharolyticus JOP 1030-1]PYH48541.1 hypothetical protein BP01DRAFT_353705 [Aspergillus saccharolyticus JOP 1030-1]
MKSLITLAACATTALAQGIFINSPPANSQLQVGETITVQVARGDYIQAMTEIGIAIGIQSCPDTRPCAPPNEYLQDLLYTGPFDPEYHTDFYDEYQNFTLTVPDVTGPAQIGVTRAYLVGAGYLTVVGSAASNYTIVA